MKTNKIIYWVTTGIIAGMMLFSAYAYLTNEQMKGAFVHLGFPDYFRVELAVAKIIGALILLVPGIPKLVKEFAYFGFAITFVSAFIAHSASGDPVSVAMTPLLFLAVLAISYFFSFKTNPVSKQLITI